MFGDKILRRIARIPPRLCRGAGLLLLAGTVIAAALVPGKEAAVAIAIVGTFFGTALLDLGLRMLHPQSQADESDPDLPRREIKLRLRQAEVARQISEDQALQSAREIARLESMRINVAAFQPILKLGLLEVETIITDFQRRIVGNEKEEVWWRNGYRQAYLGVVQIPVKAHLGVDLQRVRIREAAGNRLILSGLKMTTVTDTAQGANWVLDEIRTEYLKDKQAVNFKGHSQDPRAKQFSREQEMQVRARLNQGLDFKVFESGLIRTAEQILRVLLAPLQKEIEFEPETALDSQELPLYLKKRNLEVDSRLNALRGAPFEK